MRVAVGDRGEALREDLGHTLLHLQHPILSHLLAVLETSTEKYGSGKVFQFFFLLCVSFLENNFKISIWLVKIKLQRKCLW